MKIEFLNRERDLEFCVLKRKKPEILRKRHFGRIWDKERDQEVLHFTNLLQFLFKLKNGKH